MIHNIKIDTDLPDYVDQLIDFLFSDPVIYDRLVVRVKHRITTPNRRCLEAIERLQDGEIDNLIRTIHQQDEDIIFLSHQLSCYDSFIKKYDRLVIKVDWLKRQNKRLIERNQTLVSNVYKSKNNR